MTYIHAKKRRVRLTALCQRCGVLFYDFTQHTCGTDPDNIGPATEKK
jgi:ribosomal protein L37E